MSKEQKTAEQILLNKVGRLALSGLKWKSLDDRKHLILKAMQEYADQQNAALKESLAELIEIAEELYSYAVSTGYSNFEYGETPVDISSIIDHAKKLLNKQPQSESDKTE